MLFSGKKHKDFFVEKCVLCENTDVYTRAVIYLCGICEETRNNFDTMFDIKERAFSPQLSAGWQTGSTSKISRLAMNLWNGSCYDSKEDYDNDIMSKEFLPDSIFANEFAPYFMQAIKIRYPEYCQDKGVHFNVALDKEAKEKLDKLGLDKRSITFARVTMECYGYTNKFMITGVPAKEDIINTDELKQYISMFSDIGGDIKITVNGYSVGKGDVSELNKEELECIEKYFTELKEEYDVANISNQEFSVGVDMEM